MPRREGRARHRFGSLQLVTNDTEVRADQEESTERNIMFRSESWSIDRTGSESQDTRGREMGATVTPSTLWGQDEAEEAIF